jgi:hypothetical protein
MSDDSMVSRRGALKYMGILVATAAGREFLAKWLPIPVLADGKSDLVSLHSMQGGTDQGQPKPYTPQFFKPDEFRIVEILTEMIIPTDDTPGAKEAQVANYIDFVVFSAAEFKPALQRIWIEGLKLLDRQSQTRFSKAFVDLAGADRIKLLTEFSAPERDRTLHHDGFEFFEVAKDMTVEGFYTSKIGLIDVLDFKGQNYNAEFPGCTHPQHQQG